MSRRITSPPGSCTLRRLSSDPGRRRNSGLELRDRRECRGEQLLGDAQQLVGGVQRLKGDLQLVIGDVQQLIGGVQRRVGDVQQPVGEVQQSNGSSEASNGQWEEKKGAWPKPRPKNRMWKLNQGAGIVVGAGSSALAAFLPRNGCR